MCNLAWCSIGQIFPEGLTCMLILSIFSAVLGMVQFGYNTGVMNVPQDIFKEFISNSYRDRTRIYLTEDALELLWSITVAIFAIGGMIGGLSGGFVADWCGRKCGLLLNNALAIIGATFLCSAKLLDRFECLIFGRFFLGLNCGLNTALVPMYLSEIAPINLRGALGTVSQLGVTVGLLLSQILGFPTILGTTDNWPFLLSIAFVPAVLQLLLLPLCPESPRYLLLGKAREQDAKKALRRFRCTNDVHEDMEEMQLEAARNTEKKLTMWQLVLNKDLRMPLLIAVVMQLSQQLSGINAIFYYSTDVFRSAGLDATQAKYATSAVGGCMVVMTLVSIPLMDRAGRRTLHLTGLGGMFLTSIFLTISLLVKFLYTKMAYVSVVSVLLFTVFFAIGPGSIPWLITAELFSQGSRSAAISIAVLVNWFTNFFVGLVFPLMVIAIDNYSFLPFTFFLAIFWTFTYHKVPETKNRSFDEISQLFKRDRPAQEMLLESQQTSGGSAQQIQLSQPTVNQPKSLTENPSKEAQPIDPSSQKAIRR